MNLQDALMTSDYDTAKLEQRNIFAVVEKSDEGGYDLASGVQGMPSTTYQHAGTLQEVCSLLGELSQSEKWVPIGEEGEPQIEQA